MQDFASDRCVTRVLALDCVFSDEYLSGHAQRLGLIGKEPAPEALARLLPTVRADIQFESEAIRNAGFAHFDRLRESASVDDRVGPLSEFLDLPPETARRVAEAPYLFDD
jgi:hypothetical protein